MQNMYLQSVRIQNFKQFSDITFELDRKKNYAFNQNVLTSDGRFIKTALVFGKNGSGKTNLGLAIMDIILHLTDNIKDFTQYTNYLNVDSEERVAKFTYTFDINGKIVIYEYSKEQASFCKSEKLIFDNKLVFFVDRDSQKIETPGAINFEFTNILLDKFLQGKISILKYITSNSPLSENNPLRELVTFVEGMLYFKRVDKGNNFIGFHQQIDQNFLAYLVKHNYIEEFQVFLNEAGVNEKLVVEEDDDYQKVRLYFAHKKANLEFNEAASSGTIALALQFYWFKNLTDKTQNASFVFIDEFDSFYHTELANLIYCTFRDKCQCQCVMTTHNTNLMTNREGRCDAFYIVTPDKISAFSELTDREIREGNNVEKLYLANEFGIK